MYYWTTVIAIFDSEVESVVVHIELSSMQKMMKNVQSVQRDDNVFVFYFTFVRSIRESKIPHFVKNSELVRACIIQRRSMPEWSLHVAPECVFCYQGFPISKLHQIATIDASPA